jgi:hypothetical protein
MLASGAWFQRAWAWRGWLDQPVGERSWIAPTCADLELAYFAGRIDVLPPLTIRILITARSPERAGSHLTPPLRATPAPLLSCQISCLREALLLPGSGLGTTLGHTLRVRADHPHVTVPVPCQNAASAVNIQAHSQVAHVRCDLGMATSSAQAKRPSKQPVGVRIPLGAPPKTAGPEAPLADLDRSPRGRFSGDHLSAGWSSLRGILGMPI